MDFILFCAIRDNEKDGSLTLDESSSGLETRKNGELYLVMGLEHMPRWSMNEETLLVLGTQLGARST